jgi:hypothetical protein
MMHQREPEAGQGAAGIVGRQPHHLIFGQQQLARIGLVAGPAMRNRGRRC